MTSRSFSRTASFALSLAAVLGCLATAGVARADACSDQCLRDWPSRYLDAIPRKACEAKCAAMSLAGSAKTKVEAAWERTKDVAGAAANAARSAATTAANAARSAATTAANAAKAVAGKAVEVGKKAVDAGKKAVAAVAHLARGLYDKARACIADGVGGCLQKVVTAAGNLARGVYDKVKACVADGLGGCLTKLAKAAVEMACKGVGIVWDAARQCCAKKGTVQCVKDAAVAVAKKGAQYLCDTFARSLVPKLTEGAARLIDEASAALKGYTLRLRGSELGALTCAFESALGATIAEVSKKFGDPTLTIGDLRLRGIPGGNTVKAALGATATVSVPGKQGALVLQLEGDVDAVVDTSCNFQGPLATFGAHITKVSLGSIPKWMTDAAVAGFVNPRLGCFSFCPKPIEAAGMPVKLDYCRVIDTCLRSKCTAPVLNAVLAEVFPLGVAVETLLPKNTPDAVRRELKGWSATLGGVKMLPGAADPYRPAFSGTLSLGPAGRPKLQLAGTGTFAVKTYCGPKGSMIQVTPSLAVKAGEVPKWMQAETLTGGAQGLLRQFVDGHGGQAGRYAVAYPEWLSGKKSQDHGADALSPEKTGPGLLEKLRKSADGLKMAVQTALAGRFRGDGSACAGKQAADLGGAGACHLCMDPREFAPAPAPLAEGEVGHLTGSQVNFRSGPGMQHAPIAVLKRCAELTILDKNVKGNENFWSKVRYRGKVGYIATQYVQRGQARCEGAQPK